MKKTADLRQQVKRPNDGKDKDMIPVKAKIIKWVGIVALIVALQILNNDAVSWAVLAVALAPKGLKFIAMLMEGTK